MAPPKQSVRVFIDSYSLLAIPWWRLFKFRKKTTLFYYNFPKKWDKWACDRLLKYFDISAERVDCSYHLKLNGRGILGQACELSLKQARKNYEKFFLKKNTQLPFDSYFFQSYFEKSQAQSLLRPLTYLYAFRCAEGEDSKNIISLSKKLCLDQDTLSECLGPMQASIHLRPYFYFFDPLKVCKNILLSWMRVLMGFVFFAKNRRVVQGSAPHENKIAFEYAWGLDQGGLSELNWFGHNNIPGEKVLFFMTRPHIKYDKNITERLKSLGMHWVFLFDRKEFSKYRYSFYMKFKEAVSVQAVLLKNILKSNPLQSLKHGELTLLSKLLHDFYLWKNFIHDFNIKVIALTNEYTFGNVSTLAAAGSESCITVGRQKSYHQHVFPSASHQKLDVYFLWNQAANLGYLDNPYSDIQNIVYTGPLFNYLDEKQLKLVSEIRKEFSESVKTIVAFFDHRFVECYRKEELNFPFEQYLSREDSIDFHRKLAKKITDKKETGLILKPIVKEQKYLDDLDNIFSELISEKRCMIVLGSNTCAVASISNIVIGGWQTPTTPIEAIPFSLDKRAVFIDIKSDTHSIFWQHGRDRIIFDCFNVFFKELERYLKNPSSSDFGQFKSIEPQALPFDNKYGYIRFAEYIQTLLDVDDKEEALALANKNYTEKYGVGKLRSRKAY